MFEFDTAFPVLLEAIRGCCVAGVSWSSGEMHPRSDATVEFLDGGSERNRYYQPPPPVPMA